MLESWSKAVQHRPHRSGRQIILAVCVAMLVLATGTLQPAMSKNTRDADDNNAGTGEPETNNNTKLLAAVCCGISNLS